MALLPKKPTEERPIALTSYAYGAWCSTRYPLHDKWLQSYRPKAPWDRAVKGTSLLEVAVARLMRGEMHRQSLKSSITLLLDLKGFYENVSHVALAGNALAHEYPGTAATWCHAVISRKGHLVAENPRARKERTWIVLEL